MPDKPALSACGITFLFLLCGCAPRAVSVTAPVEAPSSFSAEGAAPIAARWWEAFGDEALNDWVGRALDSNLDLKSAWERLLAADAVVDRESSALYPSLEATADGDVRRTSGERDDSEGLSLGLRAGYELDLWGRIRATRDAEYYRARATLADYRVTALSLSAEIVRTWCRLAEARNQLELVEQQIETNETVLRLLLNRLGIGLIQGVDVLRQRQLVASTRQQRALVEAEAQILRHRLAILTGLPPRDATLAIPDGLPTLPPLPRTGLPADLINRRPDVQRALELVRAADRDLAAAIASQYPRLTFSSGVSSSEDAATSLFRDWAFSVAGGILAPIFYGGRLRAEVDRSEAIRRQRVYDYGQAVLSALREVEDALVRESTQLESIRQIDEQVMLATRAYEQLRVQYFNGTSDYLDVVTALDDVQRLQRDRLSSRLTLVEHRIALYRALAGSVDEPPGNDAAS